MGPFNTQLTVVLPVSIRIPGEFNLNYVVPIPWDQLSLLLSDLSSMDPARLSLSGAR